MRALLQFVNINCFVVSNCNINVFYKQNHTKSAQLTKVIACGTMNLSITNLGYIRDLGDSHVLQRR